MTNFYGLANLIVWSVAGFAAGIILNNLIITILR